MASMINTKEDLFKKAEELGVKIPYSDKLEVLAKSLKIGNKTFANRLCIQPMEGCDSTFEGKPDELTKRRYIRFSESGAGLLWFEATAVVKEGRANPRQVFIDKNNVESLKSLVSEVKENCIKKNNFEPMVICQLTHSGRYSKPKGTPAPLISYNNPIFEKDSPIDKSRILTDDYFKYLEKKFGEAAKLAQECGFDGADIKCCHRYLMNETLSAFNRQGEYGGSFENRTRLYLNSVENAKNSTTGDFLITSRLNIYDGFPYPYGFGINENDGITPDISEPLKLVEILKNKYGIKLLDLTIGNPYFNPHINRPFDKGPYIPNESPWTGVARAFDLIGRIKAENPDINIISSCHSYAKKFSPNIAAGVVEENIADIAGFGREAFAYPQFANDILNNRFNDKKCCITCSKCTEIMRAGGTAGCPIRDTEVYMPIYKKYCMGDK